MAISVGVVSVAVGIGIPVFFETQIDNAVSIFTFYMYSGGVEKMTVVIYFLIFLMFYEFKNAA